MAYVTEKGLTIRKRMKKFVNAYYHWLAKRRLSNQYRYLNAVNELLEKYIMERILNSSGGNSDFINKGRTDLVNKQKEIKENSNFLEFLKKQ